MPKELEIKIPDIGDFAEVEVIEIAVALGNKVEKEQSLITVESDKASMDIPSPCIGIIKAILISVGDKVSQGTAIMRIETEYKLASGKTHEKEETVPKSKKQTIINPIEHHAEVVVIGGGPGGYTAAFRAADLGKRTILVERYPALGGVCLNVGCIPSKALLHVARVITEINELKEQGIDLSCNPSPQPKLIRNWVESVINRLTSGLKTMARQRKIETIEGHAQFVSQNKIQIKHKEKSTTLSFDNAIIAAGSHAMRLPNLPDDPRIMDSTSALLLKKIPKRMLIIGGGIIGLEMATIYASLGCKITIAEMMDTLITGCDKDIVRPLQKIIKKRYENIYLRTTVTSVIANRSGLEVIFDGNETPKKDQFDAILIAIGRRPNGKMIGAEEVGIVVNEHGFIPVDAKQRTNIPNIFAIGDIIGQPMLAHKAIHEGKIAAEVIASHKSALADQLIPVVAYTDPEVAWVGLSEVQAKEKGINYGKGIFPWAASGKSLALGRDEGITKMIFDNETKHILGAAIVGSHAGDLIAECVLAIEMGADVEDISLTIHPHPTLSETIGMAADAFNGTLTDLYIPKK